MYVCYIVYNNERTIRRSLKSILPYVEKVIMVDGAFKDYPHFYPFSTDRTFYTAKKLCTDKLVWRKCTKRQNPHKLMPWKTQIDKRNRYLKLIPNGVHFIVLDDDTYLTGEVEREFKLVEKKGYTCAGIRNVNEMPIWTGKGLPPKNVWKTLKWQKTRGVSKSIYLKQKGMKYRNHHSTIYLDKENLSKSQYILKDVRLINGRGRRTWEQHIASVIYKLRRPEFEAGLQVGSPVPQRTLDWFCGGVMPSDEEIDVITRKVIGNPLFKFYNDLAENYPESEIVYSTDEGKRRLQYLRKVLKKKKGLILDLGCNDGIYKPYIKNYVGLDIALACLKKFEGDRVQAEAESLPFTNKVFDVIFAAEIIEHLKQEDRLRALKECWRVLKPKGELIMSTPYGGSPHNIRVSRGRWKESKLGEYGIPFQPYVHGRFSPKYTEKILNLTGFKSKFFKKLGTNHLITVAVKKR